MDVSDKISALPHELVLILVEFFLNTIRETDLCRDSKPKVTVLLAQFGPPCQAGYADQDGGGNGLEFSSTSGGCDPGTGGFGGVDSPEWVHSPLGPHGSKRKRARDPAQLSRSCSTKPTARTFACPYYLHDRIRHSDCLNIRLTRLSDVRQHLLERAHYQVVHCPDCGTTFHGRLGDARRQRDAHIQARTCLPLPAPPSYPGITEDQEQTIREIARNTRTNSYTEAHRWFMIWDFLFPGEPRPESPFLNDVPDIQRVFDWRTVIFENDLWLQLPNEPWTTAMGLEQRRAGMSNFIGAFIMLARDRVGQDASPVEDHHGADDSSYMGVNTPGPSIEPTNPEEVRPASIDFNRPPDASRQAYLSPTSIIGSRQAPGAHTLGQTGPSVTYPPAVAAPIPFRPFNGPARAVPQDIQQPAPPQEAADTENDPALPSRALEGSSINILTLDPDMAWLTLMFSNEDARAHDNHDPAGEDEFGSHQ